jgi:hypothetical protein
VTTSSRVSRPYLVGLGATVVAGALTVGMFISSSAAASREQAREARAAAVVDGLRLPPSITVLGSMADCTQVNIERCLRSTDTPPATLAALSRAFGAVAAVEGASCSDGTALREAMRRCSFRTALDGVPVEVMLWPHIGSERTLRLEGTDVWVDIQSERDVS